MPDLRPRRDQVLDAMRSLAIVLMASSHVSRIVSKKAWPGWSPLAMLVEPYTQALFLGLVGASLVHSLQSSRAKGIPAGAWRRTQLVRAGQLFGLSLIVFFIERGPQWPHGLLSTGILALIAAAIALFTVTIAAPRPLLWTAGLTAGLCILAGVLDITGTPVLAVNAGNGPLLPSALYTGLGATALLCWGRWGRKAGLAIATVGLLALGGSLLVAPFSALMDEPLGRSEHTLVLTGKGHGLQVLVAKLRGDALETVKATFFNPRPTLVPLVAGMVVATYLLLMPLRGLFEKAGRWLLSIGRYSLGAYLFHLVLVALPVVILGRSKPLRSPEAGTAYLLFVVLGCYGYAFVRMRMDRRAKERAKMATEPPTRSS